MRKYFALPILISLPLSTLAATNLVQLIAFISRTLNQIVPFAIGLAIVMFLYGVVKYTMAGDSDTGRQAGRQVIIWGIIAIFSMIAIWGLVNLFASSLDLDNVVADVPVLPTTP